MALEEISKRLIEKTDVMALDISKIVRKLTPELRIHKAERHIYDAYYLRTIRNDID